MQNWGKILRDMLIDELLAQLNNAGYDIQGYADDIVLLTIGRSKSIISIFAQRAFKMVKGWCKIENLGVNPVKTLLVPFTEGDWMA